MNMNNKKDNKKMTPLERRERTTSSDIPGVSSEVPPLNGTKQDETPQERPSTPLEHREKLINTGITSGESEVPPPNGQEQSEMPQENSTLPLVRREKTISPGIPKPSTDTSPIIFVPQGPDPGGTKKASASPKKPAFDSVIFSWFNRTLARVMSIIHWAGFFIFGILVIYISIQVNYFLHEIAMLPWPLFILCLTIALALLAAAIYFLGKLAYSFIRRKSSPRISFSDIKKIDQRLAMQGIDTVNAYSQLFLYVKDFRLDEWKARFAKEENDEWSHFVKVVERLCQDAGRLGAYSCKEEWIKIFRSDFQGYLDKYAGEKIHQAAKFVGA